MMTMAAVQPDAGSSSPGAGLGPAARTIVSSAVSMTGDSVVFGAGVRLGGALGGVVFGRFVAIATSGVFGLTDGAESVGATAVGSGTGDGDAVS